MTKRIKRTRMVLGVVLGVVLVVMVAAMMTISGMTKDLGEKKVANRTEAVLASAKMDGGSVQLPALFLDQKQDPCVNIYDMKKAKKLKTRQFEWTSCGYKDEAMEQGLVESELDGEHLLVAKGGKLLPNRGVKNMKRWFSEVEGKSKRYAKTANLTYKNGEVGEFSYGSEDFYPLDEERFSAGDKVNKDGHNHLFTMSLAVPVVIQMNGAESFEVEADDDTFVYVGDKLVIDMGGVHAAKIARFEITETGEIYAGIEEEMAPTGVMVAKGAEEMIRIFHADRDTGESVFRMTLTGVSVNVANVKLADADGTEVAYENYGQEAPLGVSKTTRPSTIKGNMVIMTTAGVLAVVCSVFAMMIARAILRER